MKKHVLILGSQGMLGHVINLRLRSLSDHFIVTDVARSADKLRPDIQMDITDFSSLKNLIYSTNPDIIINCVGILNFNAEINSCDAILVNSYLPHFLERTTKDKKTKVIHISTDCVFSGKKGSYTESDLKDSNDYYGRSKALGEINNAKDLTIRTSIVGPELQTNGIGLFQWFSKQSGSIHGFSKVFWNGVTTLELCRVIEACIEQNVTGLYHVVSNKIISKYELLHNFKTIFSNSQIKNIEINESYISDKSLTNTRFDLSFNVSSYEKMFADMKVWVNEHKELYPHYLHLL